MRDKWTFVGLSHHTADIALRGSASLEGDLLARAYTALVPDFDEIFILSTCNRTEFYAVGGGSDAERQLLDVWAQTAGMDPEVLGAHTRTLTGHEVGRHLFRVTAGLDAQILGETEILGQVRTALRRATELGTVGRHISTEVQAALSAARRAHRETGLDAHPVSVGSASVALARQVFGDLSGTTVLMIGAGEVANLCLTHLCEIGDPTVVVANRTQDRAEQLATRFGGRAVGWDDIDRWLEAADLVLTSTGAPHTVLYARDLRRVVRRRRGRPIVLIDLAVPHDIETQAHDISGVFLYDLDDIGRLVRHGETQRIQEAKMAEEIVDREAEAFEHRQREREAVPIIRELRGRADAVREGELERAFRRLGELAPADRRVIEQLASRIVNKLLNDPTVALKEYAADEGSEDYLKVARRLFHLDPDRPVEA